MLSAVSRTNPSSVVLTIANRATPHFPLIIAWPSFVPVVVSDAGGLPEVVRHEETGIVTQKKNSDSLAWGILEILENPDYGKSLAHNAYDDLFDRFDWSKLAKQKVGQKVRNWRLRNICQVHEPQFRSN